MPEENQNLWVGLCLKVGWRLLIMGSVMIAVAYAPTPASVLAKWTGTFFFALGFVAGAILVWQRVWKSGVVMALGCLVGAYWALTLSIEGSR